MKETLVQVMTYETVDGNTLFFYRKCPGGLIVPMVDDEEVTLVFHTENLPPNSRLFFKKGNNKIAVEIFGKTIFPSQKAIKIKVKEKEAHICIRHCGYDDKGNFIIVNPLIRSYELVTISPDGEKSYRYIPFDEVFTFTREGDKLKIIYDERNIAYKAAQKIQGVFFEDTYEVLSQEDFWKDFVEEIRIYPDCMKYGYILIGKWKNKKVKVTVDEEPMQCNWSEWGSWSECPHYCRPGDDRCFQGCEWAVLPAPITVRFLD